jgi:hypothetical protein
VDDSREGASAQYLLDPARQLTLDGREEPLRGTLAPSPSPDSGSEIRIPDSRQLELGGAEQLELRLPAPRRNDAELLELWRPALVRAAANAKRSRKAGDPRRKKLAAAIASRRQRERLEMQALRKRPRGPQLPEWCMHNSRARVVERDLTDALEGWWMSHRAEAQQLARRTGLPAVLYGLVLLLRAFAGVGDLQVRIGWAAQQLGCSERWLQLVLARHHQVVRRYRQLRRYVYATRDLSPAAQLSRWMDGRGRTHRFVELRPVLHLMDPRCELLRRRTIQDRKAWIAAGRPLALEAAFQDLMERLGPRRLRAVRLRIAPASAHPFTPYAVTPPGDHELLGPDDRSTGPPGRMEERPAAERPAKDGHPVPPRTAKHSASGVPGALSPRAVARALAAVLARDRRDRP